MNHQAAHNPRAKTTALRRGVQRYGFQGQETAFELGSSNWAFENRNYDARLGRFSSIDKKAHLYPHQSPYSIAFNSPLIYVDNEGNENIIYLVILPSAQAALSSAQILDIQMQMNSMLEAMSLRTSVRLFTNADAFDPQNLDAHDSFVLLGNSKEILSYGVSKRLNQQDIKRLGSQIDLDFQKLNNDSKNFEQGSSGPGGYPPNVAGGMGAAVASEKMNTLAQNLNVSVESATALAALHGVLSHNTNINHSSTAPLAMDACNVRSLLNPSFGLCLDDANRLVSGGGQISMEEFLSKTMMNVNFLQRAQARFGINEPKDNYATNKEVNRKMRIIKAPKKL